MTTSSIFSSFAHGGGYERNLVLFGASMGFYQFVGNTGMDINSKDDILFVCDNDANKHGKKLGDNIEVVSPERIKAYKPNEIMIIITSQYVKEISQQLKEMGYSSSIIYDYEIQMALIKKNTRRIDEVFDMLEDEKSKEVYEYVLRARMFNKYEYDFTPVAEPYRNQYFVKNMFKLTDEEIFVDAGAYDGDTIRQFLSETKENYKKIYSFEPSDVYYDAAKRYIGDYNLSENVKLFKKGAYNSDGFIYGKCGASGMFNVRRTEIAEEDSYFEKVPVATIDSITGGYATFIKMDTEGSEIPALEGARETIIKNKPKLAISIYHKIYDYWRIPLLIKSYVSDYKFFIRHHIKDYIPDTMLYAATEKDLCGK